MMGRLERLYQSHHQSLTPPFVFLSHTHISSISFNILSPFHSVTIHLSPHTVQTYWTQNLRMRDGLLVFLFSSKCFFLSSLLKSLDKTRELLKRINKGERRKERMKDDERRRRK